MKTNKYQLYIIGFALIVVVFSGSTGIIAQASLQAPENILVDTLIGEDPFIEGLELIAAQDTALIAQYYQFGGQKTFPLNPNTPAFDKLDSLIIISSEQANWQEYWPRSIWEFRDGATVVFQFSQGLEESLEDGEEIVKEIGLWMGTDIDILYGAEDGTTNPKTTTLVYWGYMSAQNHSDFIVGEFHDVLSTGGFTNFITNEKIDKSPLSVVAVGLTKSDTDWVPLAAAAFVQPTGIQLDGDIHNMSISSAFGYVGQIRPAPNALISHIEFRLPYVANVFTVEPETNNLYPELTGQFEWTLKAGVHQVIYDDIYVIYDMAVQELKTFPQITAELDVNATALISPTDPVLNYTIQMTNSGDEKAYNVAFAWELGDRPAPHYIEVFDYENYSFNESVVKYYNMADGLLYDTFQGGDAKILLQGWFIHNNGTLVLPVNTYNMTSSTYMLDLGDTYKSLLNNKSFFTFDYSSNLQEIILENGNFALLGTIDELDNGSSEEFWWSIDDIPAQDDAYLIMGWDVSVNDTIYPLEYNVTIIDNTSAYDIPTNIADYIIEEQLALGSDFRYPPLNPEFTPGVMFRYTDSAFREYFGWSNGLNVQLYDDEAMLKTIVSLNSTIFKIDEIAKIDVSVENIGTATATNVQLMGFHAQLGPDWELQNIEDFSGEETVGDGTIAPGEIKTHTFIRNVSTFLGIHPVGVVVDFTTEEGEGYAGAFNRTDIENMASNLVVAMVLPKDDKAGKDEPSYPTPIVNVSVNWNDENGGDISNGDIIEIQTEIKNLGDEPTTIVAYSYFPTRMASIDMSGPYNGQNFKVTDISGNTITDYSEGFAVDHWQFPISVAAIAGIHLVPGASIIFYYKLNVTDANSLIIPPVSVEYDSRYPMASASGVEGASGEEDVDGVPFSTGIQINTKVSNEIPSVTFSIQEDSSGSSWTSFSNSALLASFAAVGPRSTTPQSSGVSGFTALTGFITENMRLMIVVLAIPVVILVIRDRRRKI